MVNNDETLLSAVNDITPKSFRPNDSVAWAEVFYTPDGSYKPSRPSGTLKYSYSNQSGDLKDILEERVTYKKRARWQKAQRMPAQQRLAPKERITEEHIRVKDDAFAATVKASPVVEDKRATGKIQAVGQEDGRTNNHGRDLESSVLEDVELSLLAKKQVVELTLLTNFEVPCRAEFARQKASY
ncbi:hypothetical protein TEA_021825 [Camellia sinensis var. sinensis]|uniref:Uncharacterized protein n=1 Tax=Camellia sinensis var. sinensis TaxID=542762 RepID=A0A4S4DLD1_CAMSN|nr:hypothetical protein TEA_021825 [Camellia sinensis var. sinensis]